MNALIMRNVKKSFASKIVLRDISLNISDSGIYGLVGRNGAGKTTLMKAALGLLNVDDGEILVFGKPINSSDITGEVGYLPDLPEFYDYMSAKEYLSLCGGITGMSKSEVNKRIQELLHQVGLDDENIRIAHYSRGMKQRLGMAQALFNKPKLLLCDEPTSALDPVGRKEILDLLLEIGKETAVVLSTHIMSDIEKVCDQVCILEGGKIIFAGTPESILENKDHFPLEIVLKNAFDIPKILVEFPMFQQEGRKLYIEKINESKANSVLFWLISNSISVVKFEKLESSLENIILEVINR